LARRFATRRRPVGLFKVLRVFGTGAYAVSPRGAAKFLSAVFPLTKNVIGFDGASSVVLNTSLDIAMNPCLAGFDVFAFYPPAALPINDTTTSTVYSRPPLGP
jgi:hypothetical protein